MATLFRAATSIWRTLRRVMAASSAQKRPPFNPAMLAWARKWRGVSLEDAAAAVSQTPERLQEWERVKGGPTVKQARELAQLYERSFLEFFRETEPEIVEPELVPDYRMHKGAPDPSENRELKIIQMWTEAKRANALDLIEELQEDVPQIPSTIFSSLETDAEVAASRARDIVGLTFAEQLETKSYKPDEFTKILRKKFESVGVLTLRRSDIRKIEMRGMCIAVFPLPIILFAKESPQATAFTLAHEFGHIVTKQSGISGPTSQNAHIVEDWCNRFASAFLMPREVMRSIVGETPASPRKSIEDNQLAYLAQQFRVSTHAMLIRLVHLGYVHPNYYWLVKKPQFDDQEEKYKSHGRVKFYGQRFQSSLGDFYTGLVVQAWNAKKITAHTAGRFMGVESFSHLSDIREHFGKS
jgi:Zn-dependent peptidase ImmA (M78 family)